MASFYRDNLRAQIAQRSLAIHIVGFLVSGDRASLTYSQYTESCCKAVGISFELVECAKEEVAEKISQANTNPDVHGIFVYYPIFGDARDAEIKDSIQPQKDVEGLTSFWMNKLYANERFVDAGRQAKALLPCTPLAIIKLLEETKAYSDLGLPFQNKVVTIFNRSDVVGRPLAYMLANDGAKVYSFDADGGQVLFGPECGELGVEREEALLKSDVIITGVPSKTFAKIRASELKAGAIGLNFSTLQNFEDEAKEKASLYIPRVGPLTVVMCLRNALRLFENYHLAKGVPDATR